MKIFKNKFTLKLIIKIIICLIIIGFSATAIYFLSKQITKINFTMGEKKEMDYLISNREEVNNRIKTDFLEVDPDYEPKINAALPSVYNVLSFVDTMESLAKKHSLKQTLSFNQPMVAPDSSGPITLMIVNFNLAIEETNIENFISYLRDFEKLPYFTSINNINYSAPSAEGWKNNSSISISGSFYAHQ